MKAGRPRGIPRETLPVPIKVFLEADAPRTLVEMSRPTTPFLRFSFVQSAFGSNLGPLGPRMHLCPRGLSNASHEC